MQYIGPNISALQAMANTLAYVSFSLLICSAYKIKTRTTAYCIWCFCFGTNSLT